MSKITDTLIATDFPSFVRECHKICRGGKVLNSDPYLLLAFEMAEDVAAGRKPRAIVNLPPGTAKSFIFAVCLPAWILAHDPSATIMIVEHSKKLARDTTRNIRRIMLSEKFRHNFRTRIDENWKGAGDFGTTKGGSVFATSVGGTITGYRADLIVADDPLAIKDADNLEQIDSVNETFDDEIATRTRDEKSRIVVVMHRLNENDLTAHLIDQGGYKVLAIPLWAERSITYEGRYGIWHRHKGEQIRAGRYTKKELRDLAFRPSFRFLFQQAKGRGAALRIKPKHFSFFEGGADKSKPFVFSIDTAQKDKDTSSRMAIQVWQREGLNHRLVNMFSRRCDFVGLWEAFNYLVRRYPPAMILVEDTANGSALLAQAQQRLPHNLMGVVPEGSKFDRLRRHYNTIQRGRILLPRSADWAADWIEEIVAFPNGTHDDQVDALSMYLDFMATRPVLIAPEGGGGLGAIVSSHGVRSGIPRGAGPSTRSHVALAMNPRPYPPTAPAGNGGHNLDWGAPVKVETASGAVILRRR
jgi:predicted phage terminase large subunit-like protein